MTGTPPSATSRGFTFLEILVVLAVMGVLAGIGIGYLQNVGAASRVDQARGILRETIFACKQSSNGGTRAIFDLRYRPSDRTILVGAAVARAVLTHNFELLDSVSHDYPMKVNGEVEVVEDGYVGGAAKFSGAGNITFDPQSAFAMTEGLEIDVWIKPDTGASEDDDQGRSSSAAGTMTLIQGMGAYELQIQKDPRSDGYDVWLYLHLVPVGGAGRDVATRRPFRTKGGPLRLNTTDWNRLQVGFDGADASIRINGKEHASARLARRRGTRSAVEESGMHRILVPPEGAVRLIVGGTDNPYVGLMDTLVLQGVFRSSDVERELYGLILEHEGWPERPVRVIYRNGRLDPARHASDVVLLFEEELNIGGPRLEVRLGMYGTVQERLVRGRGR